MGLLSLGASTCFDHIFKIEQFPGVGETVTFREPKLDYINRVHYGGCAFNSGVVAGVLVKEIGCIYFVGEDFYETDYYDYLQEKGIDCEGIIRVPKSRSGHCFIANDPSGKDFKLINTGASEHAEQFSPDAELIERFDHLLVHPVLNDFTLEALKEARRLGKKTALNGFIQFKPRAFLSNVDYLFMNQYEVDGLLDDLGRSAPADLLSEGPEALFITRGKRGSKVITPEEEADVSAVETPNVTDTTGAGDAFVGGAAACLIRGGSPRVAAQVGSVTSSFVIEEIGCQTNIPSQKAIKDRYESEFGGFQLDFNSSD